MNCTRSHLRTAFLTALALALAFIAAAPSARANVYATNIKLNGALTNATVGQGSSVTITYILNEAASAGVTIKIFSGATAVRTINIAGGSPGTTAGLNTVTWNGKNDASANVPVGSYSVSITAASNGYLYWTQVISNANPKVFWPAGVVADTKIDSIYYGRVMAANGVSTANNVAPHPVGIVKFNADGSEADEGQSDAGNPFRTDTINGDSVRSLKFGDDDRVYWENWITYGQISAADMAMTTNQLLLDCDQNPNLNNLVYGVSGLDITDPGTTNALIWVTDASDYPSVGVWAFPLTNNGVADSVNGGINVLATGPNIPLVCGPGIMISDSGDIYIGEVRNNAGDASPRCICITNVWPSGIDGTPTNWWNGTESYPITSTRLNWAVGQSDDTFRYENQVAIDSRKNPKYVSVSMGGGSGGGKILSAADGTLVTNIFNNSTVFYIGTSWDAVGNVYFGNAAHSWEMWSPPGANTNTTPAVPLIQVTAAATRPHITNISVSGGTVTINFTGDASDPASAFTLVSSGVANGTYNPTVGASITGSAGTYQATAPTSGAIQFYRIRR
jgi:hypothetical protein